MNLYDFLFVGGGISVLFVCFIFIFLSFFFFKTTLFFWNSKSLKACAGNTDGAGFVSSGPREAQKPPQGLPDPVQSWVSSGAGSETEPCHLVPTLPLFLLLLLPLLQLLLH